MTIASNDENNFVASGAKNVSWIGAEWNQSMLDYTWVDGSGIGYSESWKSKQKNSSLCVGICKSGAIDQCNNAGEWYQENCVQLKPFVCERIGKWQTHNGINES